MNGPTETPQQAARRLAASAIREGYKSEALHTYTDAEGRALYWRIRLKHPDTGDKWIRPMRMNDEGFELGEPEHLNGKPLYRLHELTARPDDPVFVVEGEKDADALAERGVLATASGGANSAGKADWGPLAGRSVTIWPDNDEAGQRYAQDVATALAVQGCKVSVIDVAALSLSPKGDAVDWLAAHLNTTAEDILSLKTAETAGVDCETYATLIQRAATADVASVSGIIANIAEAGLSRTKQETILRKLKDSTGATLQALRGDLIGALKDAGVIGDQDAVAAILIDLAREAGVDLWHDPDKNPWATLQLDDHIEHHALKTKAVRRYLQKLYFESTGGGNGGKGKAAGGEAMQAALGVLEAKAVFNGETHKPYIRVAEVNGVIYLDLCNEAWEVVRITAKEWQVVAAKDCSIRFRRSRGMQALPYPTNGDLGLLAAVLGEDMAGPNWKLIVGWQLGSLRGDIPFPVLCGNGEQGSGKSTRCKIIRSVIDPSTSSLRNTPRESRDLFISASNSWIQCFDNVSGLSDWLSDDLCRLATGGGLATRELYTDDEETILDVRRPIILNGITDFITRPDLIDRTCLVTFQAISEESRKAESDILADFESAHAKILGALLTVASAGLSELPNTRLEKLPRMADFALWVTACEKALGWEQTSFVETFAEARQDMIGAALESEPIIGPMRRLVEQGKWTGSTSELMDKLITLAALDPAKRLPDGWPKNAKALGHKLKRLAPALRGHGIDLKHLSKNTDGSRPWTVGTCVARPLGTSRDGNAVNPVIAETPSHKAYGDGVVQPMPPRTPPRTPSPKPAPDKAYGDDGDDGDVFPTQSSAGGEGRTVRGFIE